MSVDFYARNDLPLAQELVRKNEIEFFPRLLDLLKTLDPELSDDSALIAAYKIITKEEFITFYYYLTYYPPAAAMFYLLTFIKASHLSKISKIYQGMVSDFFSENGPILNSLTINVDEDKAIGVFICYCEILLPVLKPEYDSAEVMKQFEMFRTYAILRNYIKSSDYLERNLEELDELLEEYLRGKISLIEFIDKLTCLEIYANKEVKRLGYVAISLTRSGNMDPKVAIHKEVEKINQWITIDNNVTRFIKTQSPEDAFYWLEFYIDKLPEQGEAYAEIKKSLILERIEFAIKDSIEEDNYETILNSLLEAAQRFPEFPELVEFFNTLRTSPLDRDYVIDSSTSESVKGFVLLTLITLATIEFVNLILKDSDYSELISGMFEAVQQISTILLQIKDPQVKVIVTARILNMLSRNSMHYDTLLEFLSNTLPKLDLDKHDLFSHLNSDAKLQPEIIAWLTKES